MVNLNNMIETGWCGPTFCDYLSQDVYHNGSLCALNYSNYFFLAHESNIPIQLNNQTNLTDMEISYFGGEITDSELVFYNQIKKLYIASSKKSLQYYFVPNIVGNMGVAYTSTFTQNINPQLFSSGQLSGCTVCVCYLPQEEKIHFFHVGGNGVTYSQKDKFNDLLKALYYVIYNESPNKIAVSVDTVENFSKELETIGKKRQVVIGVYYRNYEGDITIKNKIAATRSNICIKSYGSDEYGELLASNNKNKFFSIYFCKNKPTAPIEICKRKNYSK